MIVLNHKRKALAPLRRSASECLAIEPAELREVIRQVVAIARPLRVILFGSRARGDARPDSDWDLMVVVSEGTHRLHTSLKLYGEVRKNGLACDFLVSTPEDFKRYSYHASLVYKYVLEEGVDLYVA
jgi:predicted nucleotidyltransferase